MPFYVEYSTKRRTVKPKSVSPVQFIICSPNGTAIWMHVVLNDYINHRNVTFTWEQIEGTEAILSNYDQLSTSFEYSDTNTTDKIFRFSVDKGTARETYIDARVYHTPISFMGAGESLHNHYGTKVLTVDSQVQTSIIAGYSREIVVDVPSTPVLLLNLSYVIEAEMLTHGTKIDVLYSPVPTLEPYILEGTMLPENGQFPDTYSAQVGYYTFVLTVTYPGGNVHKYYSHLQVINVADELSENLSHGVDDLIHIGYDVNTKNIRHFTTKKVSGTDTDQLGVGVISEAIIRYNPVPVLADGTSDMPVGTSVETKNILKLNPSGVGSP